MLKYYETNFEEYITECKKINIHPELEQIYTSFSKNIEEMPNLIFYGPKGSGKYTQMLYFLSLYNKIQLKHKKVYITYNKQEYFFKISDVHYEIDMSTLGCNSKLLWQDIYLFFEDIINSMPDKKGFIVLKNFHDIHNELLDILYSYIQDNLFKKNNIKFIFITENLSFISDNILNTFVVINIKKPNKKIYKKLITCKNNDLLNNKYLNFDNVTNIKLLYFNYFENVSIPIVNTSSILETPDTDININMNNSSKTSKTLQNKNKTKKIDTKQNEIKKINTKIPEENNIEINLETHIKEFDNISLKHQFLCDEIIRNLLKKNKINLTEFRILLYNIFIYGHNLSECIWYILEKLQYKLITNSNISLILLNTFKFFKYYNNNYRPIYHLEKYFIYLMNHL